ncbi:MAG: type II toxin-antitoxin system RelE/ParE family toxin [Candidatus Sericytochromatia bacterium]|nr:type II toxin-antitoxin system RelE/ParE family toxin [Candidatus Tanganyikabacteria bacterium]
MAWRYELAPSAKRDLKRLDRATIERIRAALDRLAETGQGDVTRLTAKGGELRLRVGDWRVRFERDESTSVFSVLRVLRRSEDTYRD